MSLIRMRTSSRHPVQKPATTPTRVPSTPAITLARKPTRSYAPEHHDEVKHGESERADRGDRHPADAPVREDVLDLVRAAEDERHVQRDECDHGRETVG